MDNVKKNFGFGCMRLPMIGEEVDIEQTKQMVDAFLDAGFNYFDTAHGYIQGKSEKALKTCLTSRYPREKYILTDKLTANYFKTEADIRPFFESQLEICGVEYFDFYLMHAQGLVNYDHFKECRAYETAFELKKEGKIRHVGISFHDRAEVLERILTEYPEIEVVQIQFNYIDYDDPAVQSRKCYEVCRKFNKPVIVMEPVKGGNLVNLPENAKAVLEDLHGGSPASYAIRFVAGFPGMMMVLSGMSNMEQMQDNISFMRDFKPLDETERAAVEKVQEIFHSKNLIPCTACRYCTDGCPKHISIPDLFAIMNTKQIHHDWNADCYYEDVYTAPGRKASDCLKCGKCEKVTPMDEMIRHPGSVSAARLAGCKNFFAAEAKDGKVYLPEWNVALPLVVTEKPFTTLGILDNAVTLSESGGMSCTVCRMIPGVEENILLLRPEGSAEGAPMLRIAVGHESDLQAGAAVRVALDYSKLLLL